MNTNIKVQQFGSHRKSNGKIQHYPILSLRGRYLEEHGFEYGSNTIVTVKKNKIIIKKI
jgi:hypothetical protein